MPGSGTANHLTYFKTASHSAGRTTHNVAIDGSLGIGTTTPQNKLDVCGTIRSKELVISDTWCDYVFDADYELTSLEEKDQFIQKNGHLPEFESAEAMGGDIQIADVTKRQQVSIEEITLHLIEMNKELKALKAENAALRKAVFKE